MTDINSEVQKWYEISPADAVDLDLSVRLDIDAPLNEEGERCPWPWDPQQLVGAPLGQYHCPYCGAMVLAGMPHPDYRGVDEDYQRYIDEQMSELPDRDPGNDQQGDPLVFGELPESPDSRGG